MPSTAIVIGSGGAGISAAFRLKKAGFDVQILERDNELGGRSKSITIDGFTFDLAAGLLPECYDATFRLLRDAGLEDLRQKVSGPLAVATQDELFYIDGSNVGKWLLQTKLISFGSKLKLIPLIGKAMSMWGDLDFEDLGRAAPHDNESLADYARRALNPELLERILNPTQKLMYCGSAEQTSLVDLFWSAKFLFSKNTYCIKGGTGEMINRIGSDLNVRLGTTVTSVVESGNQVVVTSKTSDGIDTVDKVDVCVIATPACEVPKIDRGLPESARQYLSQLQYTMMTDIHLRLKRPPPNNQALMIMVPDSVEPDMSAFLLEHNKSPARVPPGKGAISVFFIDPWTRTVFDKSDEEIFELGMRKAEKALPGLSELVEGYYVKKWAFGVTLSHPGSYKEMAAFTNGLDTERRVQLAGDYFSLASINGAIASGEKAANRLIKR